MSVDELGNRERKPSKLRCFFSPKSGCASSPGLYSGDWVGYPVLRYIFAFVAVGIATLARIWIVSNFDDAHTYMTFYPAVVLVALFCGEIPGIFAALLTAVSVTYIVSGPESPLSSVHKSDRIALISFVILTIAICMIFGRLQAERRTHVQQIERERQLLLTVLNTIHDHVIAVDLSGKIQIINSAGDRDANLIGQNVFNSDFVRVRGLYKWDKQTHYSVHELPLARALKGEVVDNFEIYIKPPGAPAGQYCLAYARPLLGENGVTHGALVVVNDVTESRALLAAFSEANERFRIALDQSPISVFQMDRALRYTWIYNPPRPWAHLDWIGKTGAEVFKKDDAAISTALKQRVLETGKSFRGEVSFKHAGGVNFFDFSLEPTRKASGEIVGITGAATDLTELKKIEQEIRENRERLILALNAAQAGIFDYDVKSKRLGLSPELETLFGYNPGGFHGRLTEFLSLVFEEDREGIRKALKNAMASGKLDGECRIRRPSDGQVIYMSAHGRMRYNDAGKPTGLVGIGVNITARRQLEMDLLRSQKMEAIGRLAGGVAHDFNNILGIILGHVELLQDLFPDGNEAAIHAREIRASTERAASLTRQLLAFSRKQLLQSKVIDLNELISGVLGMLSRLISENIELIFELGADLDKVRLDPGQMEQVLMNLVINARDAMPEGGKLTIKTSNIEVDDSLIRENSFLERGPHVLVQIIDTGGGIDKETQARIFEPFFTTKSMGKGTGLGLSIVYGIVKQSRGFIVVNSESGKGTAFSLYFPRVTAPQHSETLPPQKLSNKPEGIHTTIAGEGEVPLKGMIRKGGVVAN